MGLLVLRPYSNEIVSFYSLVTDGFDPLVTNTGEYLIWD